MRDGGDEVLTHPLQRTLLREVPEGVDRAVLDEVGAAAGAVGGAFKKVVVVANLKPRQMKFGLSEGMVLVAGQPGSLRICTFDPGTKAGDRIS